MVVKEAILLAAGLGTRLRPITDKTPKCLVDINGVPLLHIWLEQLESIGIERIHINTHYLSNKVEEFINQSLYRHNIIVHHEEELLGTAGSLKEMLYSVESESVLVAHADNYCECDWLSFISKYEKRNCLKDSLMMLFRAPEPKSCGIVELDDNHNVIAFHEKVENPPSNLASAAIYLMPKQYIQTKLELIEQTNPDISQDLIPLLIGHLQTWSNDGYICDIGTLAALNYTRHRVSEIANS